MGFQTHNSGWYDTVDKKPNNQIGVIKANKLTFKNEVKDEKKKMR